MEVVQHGVEGLMYLMTESSKYMVTCSHADHFKRGKITSQYVPDIGNIAYVQIDSDHTALAFV